MNGGSRPQAVACHGLLWGHPSTRSDTQLVLLQRKGGLVVVELALLSADMLVDRQNRCNYDEELMILAHKVVDRVPELLADSARK